jgi:hypothetical protein
LKIDFRDPEIWTAVGVCIFLTSPLWLIGLAIWHDPSITQQKAVVEQKDDKNPVTPARLWQANQLRPKPNFTSPAGRHR